MPDIPEQATRSRLAILGLRLSNWFERWFPDAFALAIEVARRVRDADYRALGAAAYLGVGSVWALGLSSSAALIMATPASLPDSIERISGTIPLSQTLGLWQSLLIAAAIIVVSMAVCYYSAPAAADARGMAEMGVTY